MADTDNSRQETRVFNPPAVLAQNEATGGARDAGIGHGARRKPTKEQVRAWLVGRMARPVPLPSMEQIRQELGWTLADRQMSPMPDTAENAS